MGLAHEVTVGGWRLGHADVKEMWDFDITWLQNARGLMSILNRFTDNFFQFVIKTFKQNSKCKKIEVIPFSKFQLFPIVLEEFKSPDDLYKTKLSIKKNVRQLYLGDLQPSDYAATEMLIFDVNNYNLQNWYSARLAEWHRMYQYINRDHEYVAMVANYLQDLNNRFSTETESELLI